MTEIADQLFKRRGPGRRGWYAKDRPENGAFRAVVNQAQTADEQLRLTRDYFDALVAGVATGLSAAA